MTGTACVCGHRRHRRECRCGCTDYLADNGEDDCALYWGWYLHRGDVYHYHHQGTT